MKRVALFIASVGLLGAIGAAPATAGGFDQYGYNYTARIFVGAADGSDRTLDGKVWGDPTYANDHLVMKWSKAWNDARFNGAPWTTDAWVTNEWSGRNPDGSGWTEHFKAVWVGDCVTNPDLVPAGGYCIWGQFAAITDFGMDPDNQRYVAAKAVPAGLGR